MNDARRHAIFLATAAGAALGVAYVAAWATSGGGSGFDFHCYFVADPVHPAYTGLNPEAWQYSPALAWAGPFLRHAPELLDLTLWRLVLVVAVVAMAGPWSPLVLLTIPVASELNLGNVNLIVSLAVAAGFRWPAAWAFVLLTKPTAALGLLWFVVRGDWRPIRIALGAAAAIAAVSFALEPQAWFAWAAYLIGHDAPTTQGLPNLWLRFPFAVVAAVVGGQKGWRPAGVIAAWLALPVWYGVSAAALVGALAFTWPSPLNGATMKGGDPERPSQEDARRSRHLAWPSHA